jgi:predicted AlkP superfamily pyrophosphatase or phosphodiesterase
MAPIIRRVIIVVLDGLRPDAIEAFELSNIRTLMGSGAWSRDATTVGPSLTAAAMTSLMTGVSPARHGIASDTILIPRTNAGLSPLPDVLAARGYPSSAFMGAVAPIFRGLASRVARRLGFGVSRFAGKGAGEILATARTTLRSQRRGLIVLHWPDADAAGHAHGWMSEPYRQGCLAPRLVDVPATALWALGIDVPRSYEGRVLHEAFTPAREMTVAT